MSEENLKELDSILDKPYTMENGYTRGWQTKDVQILIKSKFGVSYGSRHIRRIISNLGKDVVIICMDEAHFTIDADRRKCWARKGTTPIVYMNGSKEAINVGGALTGHGKFHYQEMSHQIKEEMLKFVKSTDLISSALICVNLCQ